MKLQSIAKMKKMDAANNPGKTPPRAIASRQCKNLSPCDVVYPATFVLVKAKTNAEAEKR